MSATVILDNPTLPYYSINYSTLSYLMLLIIFGRLTPYPYYLFTNKWWSCVVSNKRGRVSALLGPHQHALVRM